MHANKSFVSMCKTRQDRGSPHSSMAFNCRVMVLSAVDAQPNAQAVLRVIRAGAMASAMTT